jgi:hypothetical protein
MSSFQEILRKLEKGELPEELDFRPKEQTPEIDWAKIQYNTYYRSDEYITNLFPNSMAFQNLPASDKIIESIRDNITTPLEEMKERQKILTNIIEVSDEDEEEQTNTV